MHPVELPAWLHADDADTDMLARARGLCRLAERGLTARDPMVREIASDLLTWLQNAAPEPLEAALGLSGGGRAALRQQMRLANRDAALRAIARMEPFQKLNTAAAARLIVQDWTRYETTAWPRHRAAEASPVAEPDAAFFRLLADDHPVPSADHLARILRRFPADNGDFEPIEIPLASGHHRK